MSSPPAPWQHHFPSVEDPSRWARLRTTAARFYRLSPIGAWSLGAWVLLLLIAVAAPLIAPYDPNEADYAAVRQAPTATHWLGTDNLGRDILSRIVFGTRITLMVSLIAVFVGDFLGFVWGIGSGFLGHRFDLMSQRLVDILMSFPSLILALMLLVVLGAGLETVIAAIAVTQIPSATRITRSVVLSVRESMYVEAARMIGVTNLGLMVRHVAPQVMAPILVVVSLHLGGAIFAESALSFLGLGIPPPDASWGNMLGGVTAAAFKPPWWLVVFPGLAITFAIMTANLFGDSLRDFLDPKLRQRID